MRERRVVEASLTVGREVQNAMLCSVGKHHASRSKVLHKTASANNRYNTACFLHHRRQLTTAVPNDQSASFRPAERPARLAQRQKTARWCGPDLKSFRDVLVPVVERMKWHPMRGAIRDDNQPLHATQVLRHRFEQHPV